MNTEIVLELLEKAEKSFGKGSLMLLNKKSNEKLPVISTGSISLDSAIGVGGFPKGRIVEIYGPESSGKTTIALHAIAEAQKSGGVAALIDAEHAFDCSYAKALGVDVDKLLVSQPDCGEQALDMVSMLVKSEQVSIIVIDSVAALVPRDELQGDMGENKIGMQARLMSQALRKLTCNVSKTGTICIFINQLREKIGVMFGSPETTPGGNALKFFSSVRLDVRRTAQIKGMNGDAIGSNTKVKVIKNKVAPPFKVVEFDIIYGKGISKYSEIVNRALDSNIIVRSGSWYSFEGEKIAQGKEATMAYLENNPEIFSKILSKYTEINY